jgi:TonB family protein
MPGHENGPAGALQVGSFEGTRPPTKAPPANNTPVAAAGFGDGVVSRTGNRESGAAPASANFGSPETAGSHSPARGVVASTPFDQVAANPPASRAVLKPSAVQADLRILDKPRPLYSEEGRRLRIEGDVVLEVLFGASGRIRVLRTIRGLGRGLDENAVSAALGIRFQPAMENGFATDTIAVVRITFQLAY